MHSGQKIPLWEVIALFVFILVALCWGRDVFGSLLGEIFGSSYGETHITLVLCAVVAGLVAWRHGYNYAFIEAGIYAAMNRAMPAIIILGIVGMLIGSWMAGGVVPAMIYYGLCILKPSIFYLAVCLICAIVGTCTGSSWTTAGTVGVAFIGIAIGLDMSEAITAGAVVSGAYFGDKMSPFSDSCNIASAAAGVPLFEHIKHMIYSVTPALIIALILYTILGVGHSNADADMSQVEAIKSGLMANFNIHLGLLLPPVIVIVVIAMKVPAFPGLLIGAFMGCICGVLWQGASVGDQPGILHYGFSFADPDSVMPELVSLCERGGLDSMLWTMSLLMCAMSLGGVMESTGMLITLAEALLKAAKSTGALILVTVITCIFMNMIAGDSCLTSILTGRMYKEEFENRRLKTKNLSRALEDSGTMTAPLIPWNSCGATMRAFLGVSNFAFMPYAYLNLLTPIISVVYGYTGFTIQKMTDEEYELCMKQREEDRIAAEKQLEA